MPRYNDEWVVSKALFEYTTGGSCACCAFPAIFDPNGLKGLISSVSDLETDAANAEYQAAQESPFPPEMRDSIWADRVRVRHKMKKEMETYKEFFEEVGEEEVRRFCVEDLGVKGLKKLLQMSRTEVTSILSHRYGVCPAFGTVICAVVEQVANFKLTKYETDSRGEEEIMFEKSLLYDRFGGFVLDISQSSSDQPEVNLETLSVLMGVMKTLGGPKLLHRGPKSSKGKGDEDDGEDDDDEGGADDAMPGKSQKPKKGQSFRSDRRIARLIIARYWADQIIAKYKESCKSE